MSPATLPNELLHDIFSRLSSFQSTLFHVSLASRTFCNIAKPILYSRISIWSKKSRGLLKRVTKEDAQLVKSLFMDGSNRDWTAATETEDLYDEAHDCLRELFEGAFLDISSLEVLYVNNICPTDGTSEIKLGKTKPATNLRELTIQGHPYGGSFWDTVLKHERDRPRLAQVKISGVSYTSVRHLAYTSLEIPDWRGYLHDSPLLPRLANSVDVMMVHECCAERLAQCSGVLFWGTSLSSVIETWVYFQGCNLRFPEAAGNLSSNLQLMLDAIGPAPRRSFYLSLPWKRSQLFGNSLSILSAMEELGVETHFKNDEKEEEENYVIARMPRSFVDFVKRQKEAETRKEVEEEQ